MLRTIDEKWKDHLYSMDQLREGINLRAYGQKNPLLEYKSEGFKMFQEMMGDISAITIQRLFRTQASRNGGIFHSKKASNGENGNFSSRYNWDGVKRCRY